MSHPFPSSLPTHTPPHSLPIQVGNPGLTYPQQQAHFFAWCVIASPLLIGTDLVSGIDNATLALLSAPEVLAVSQDPLGVQGVRVTAPNLSGPECWARPLADGSVAALLLNRGGASAQVTCTWEELGLPAGATADVRDLWLRKDLGPSTGGFSAQLDGTSAMLVKVKQGA
jgi:alpha-galactosidase